MEKNRDSKSLMMTYYFDESGSFNSIDTHVLCPVIISGDMDMEKAFKAVWNQNFPDLPWSEFHANVLKYQGREDELRAVFQLCHDYIKEHENMNLTYIYFQSRQSSRFDFYPAMVKYFFIQEAKSLSEKAELALKSYDDCNFKMKIYLAERNPLNLPLYSNKMQKVILKSVRGHMGSPEAARRVNLHLAIHTPPVADYVLLTVSDLFSNQVRSMMINSSLDHTITQALKSVKGYIMKDISLKKEHDFCEQAYGRMPILPGPDTSHVKEINTMMPKDEVIQVASLAVELVERLSRPGATVSSEAIDRIVKKLKSQQPEQRLLEMERLYQSAHDVIQVKRDYKTGQKSTEMIFELLDLERGKGEFSTKSLARLTLLTTDLMVMVSNHQGEYICEHDRIHQAEALVQSLRQDQAYWLMLARYKNHLAVNAQNAFQFDQAVTLLSKLVEYYGRDLKNPHGGKGMQAREIGALFGTYACTLAFSGHCNWLSGRGIDPTHLLDEAYLYSEMAIEQFDEDRDIRTQHIYQAHFDLQRYILLNNGDALTNTLVRLENDEKLLVDVEVFTDLFPQPGALGSAYGMSVWLKAAYLAGRAPIWLESVARVLLDHAAGLPTYHPLEQVLAYTALLSPDKATGRKLEQSLIDTPFSEGVVRIIQNVLKMQIDYHRRGVVDPEIVDQTLNAVTPAIEPQWRAYGLDRALKTFKAPGSRRTVGPMEVLPFNYV